ncbi:hypothetical protein EDB89DRAFT_1901952 [Lactarius sanguifluus]|nr:hypothetical protein EDB89DRAFT_1901952 [Lactarius sanguifluus]
MAIAQPTTRLLPTDFVGCATGYGRLEPVPTVSNWRGPGAGRERRGQGRGSYRGCGSDLRCTPQHHGIGTTHYCCPIPWVIIMTPYTVVCCVVCVTCVVVIVVVVARGRLVFTSLSPLSSWTWTPSWLKWSGCLASSSSSSFEARRRQLNHNDGADHDDNTTTTTIGTCKATSNGRKPKLARNSDDNDSRRRFKTTWQTTVVMERRWGAGTTFYSCAIVVLVLFYNSIRPQPRIAVLGPNCNRKSGCLRLRSGRVAVFFQFQQLDLKTLVVVAIADQLVGLLAMGVRCCLVGAIAVRLPCCRRGLSCCCLVIAAAGVVVSMPLVRGVVVGAVVAGCTPRWKDTKSHASWAIPICARPRTREHRACGDPNHDDGGNKWPQPQQQLQHQRRQQTQPQVHNQDYNTSERANTRRGRPQQQRARQQQQHKDNGEVATTTDGKTMSAATTTSPTTQHIGWRAADIII